MKIDRGLLERVARNARLNLTKEEEERFLPEMKEILEAFSKLDEVDTKNVNGVVQPVELKNVVRADKAEKCLEQNDALRNTKHKKDKYFVGPRAI